MRLISVFFNELKNNLPVTVNLPINMKNTLSNSCQIITETQEQFTTLFPTHRMLRLALDTGVDTSSMEQQKGVGSLASEWRKQQAVIEHGKLDKAA